MKSKTTRAGGKMVPSFLAKGESKTARPAKQAVMSKPGESAKRSGEKTGKRGGRW
jgi:hypothetical protein